MAALGVASPSGVTAAIAALALVVGLPETVIGLPLPLLLVIVVQSLGLLVGREMEGGAWRGLWLQALLTTAVVLPLLVIQAAAAREPFVSWALGSAGMLGWATLAAITAVLGVAGLAAVQTVGEPENAAIFFLPTTLLVPAVLGMPRGFDQGEALTALAEVMALAAAAAAIGWLLPRGARLLVGPAALATQFAVLWLLGFRPRFGAEHGAIVVFASALVLVAAIVAAVLTPLGALLGRRLLRAGSAERGIPRRRLPHSPWSTPDSAEAGPGTAAAWREEDD